MTDVLVLQDVSKTYRPAGRSAVAALDQVELSVPVGTFKVVCGHSGSGKSTLLLSAGGLQKPDGGQVLVKGTDVYRLSSEKRARFRAETMGYVFQQFHLIPYLNILENVMAPSLALAGDIAQLEQRARAMIAQFGVEHRLDHPPSELSIGERQRVALARALVNEPALLLADEPTGNLDERNSEIVIQHLRDFASRGGAVLLATHDMRIEADEKLLLENGRLELFAK